MEAVISTLAQRRPTERRLPGPVANPAVPEIVAELSGNHGGSLDNALNLIRAARDAGANSVKFQCFEPIELAIKRHGIKWNGKVLNPAELVALYRKTHTPKAWFPAMIAECNRVGIAWFASAFSPADVAFLETIGCPRYKISAYEMLDGDLINAVVATGKPIIMSVRPTERVTILHATDYDGSFAPIGVSDHSKNGGLYLGWEPTMIERHIMLPDVPCEDKAFSSTPDEFARYVRMTRS